MRKVTFLFCLAFLLSLTACQPASRKEKVWLVVDFQSQVPLKYKLVSERDSFVTFDAKSSKMKPDKTYEKLELVISYKPVGKPDVYGLTTIEATCHSAKVTRKAKNKPSGKDAVEGLAGRSYTFKVSATGKITDYSNLDKLAAELGAKAISETSQGRIKAPDMVADFVCLQWHLWDSVATSGQTTSGLKPGASWTTKQFIPLPIPIGFVRNTTYTLGDVETGAQEQKKVAIDSTYTTGEGGLEHWPKIYTGGFRMKGMFGFLRRFNVASVEGAGRQIFDVEKGLLEKDTQQYKVKILANIFGNLPGVSPEITVDQKMTVELLDN
ncbi:MAG: hypothetical protein FVQ82_11340 [Planctomycetes bacterium]|nr:hypothetical protein [Planctomycetota bacterium]